MVLIRDSQKMLAFKVTAKIWSKPRQSSVFVSLRVLVFGEPCGAGKMLLPQPSTPLPWRACPAWEKSLQKGDSSPTPALSTLMKMSSARNSRQWGSVPLHQLVEGRDGVPARCSSCTTPARFSRVHLPKLLVPEVHCIKRITEISTLKQFYFNPCKPTLCIWKPL